MGIRSSENIPIDLVYELEMLNTMETQCNYHKGIDSEEPLTFPLLQITNISDGFGLTVEIKNDGNMDISKIEVCMDVSGGVKIFKPTLNYFIPILRIGTSIKIHMKPFGIGLGLFKKKPLISVTADSPDVATVEKTYEAKIFGSFINILREITYTNKSYEGYTLFAPQASDVTFLINNSGDIVHIWNSAYHIAKSVYLLENGNILRGCVPGPNPVFWGGGIGGRVEEIDRNGTIVWAFEYSNDMHCLHHDIEPLPNGNILMSA
jgi:hypothetical protein